MAYPPGDNAIMIVSIANFFKQLKNNITRRHTATTILLTKKRLTN